jgi:hypothetical protein
VQERQGGRRETVLKESGIGKTQEEFYRREVQEQGGRGKVQDKSSRGMCKIKAAGECTR